MRKARYVIKCLLCDSVVEGLNAASNLCQADTAKGEVKWSVPEIRYLTQV